MIELLTETLIPKMMVIASFTLLSLTFILRSQREKSNRSKSTTTTSTSSSSSPFHFISPSLSCSSPSSFSYSKGQREELLLPKFGGRIGRGSHVRRSDTSEPNSSVQIRNRWMEGRKVNQSKSLKNYYLNIQYQLKLK